MKVNQLLEKRCPKGWDHDSLKTPFYKNAVQAIKSSNGGFPQQLGNLKLKRWSFEVNLQPKEDRL